MVTLKQRLEMWLDENAIPFQVNLIEVKRELGPRAIDQGRRVVDNFGRENHFFAQAYSRDLGQTPYQTQVDDFLDDGLAGLLNNFLHYQVGQVGVAQVDPKILDLGELDQDVRNRCTTVGLVAGGVVGLGAFALTGNPLVGLVSFAVPGYFVDQGCELYHRRERFQGVRREVLNAARRTDHYVSELHEVFGEL